MIATKIIPCFCFITISGKELSSLTGIRSDAIQTFISVSDQFDNDIAAFNNAMSIIDMAFGKRDYSLTKEFNPQFYPSIEIDAQLLSDEDEIMLEEINQQLSHENKMIIPISKNFDILGDHVQSKILAHNNDMSVDIKIIASPSHYIQEKSEEQIQKIANKNVLQDQKKLTYH